jgi:hypothetical protein
MKKKVSQCDVHAAVVQHCGVGYSACDIAQCKGPHFTEKVGLAFMLPNGFIDAQRMHGIYV